MEIRGSPPSSSSSSSSSSTYCNNPAHVVPFPICKVGLLHRSSGCFCLGYGVDSFGGRIYRCKSSSLEATPHIVSSEGMPSLLPKSQECDGQIQVRVMPMDVVDMGEKMKLSFHFLEEIMEPPSVEDLIGMLEKCMTTKDLALSKHIYLKVFAYGLESYDFLGAYLIQLFIQCRSFSIAIQILDRLADRQQLLWAYVIKGLVECGETSRALKLFARMKEENAYVGKQLYLSLLRVCSNLCYMEQGRELHINIVKKGLDQDIYVGNSVVDLYAKCGFTVDAYCVFEKLTDRDVVSWNALMMGYAEDGLFEKCLECLDCMQSEGVYPNTVTFVCCLKACNSINAISKMLQMHTEIMIEGYEDNTFLGSMLVDLYSKFGLLNEAQEVFDELPYRDIVVWTSLLLGYIEHGFDEHALCILEKLKLEVNPNAVTYICVLRACGNLKALDTGRAIHCEIVKEEFDRDPVVCNTLMGMYVTCGSLVDARDIFDTSASQDVVSWTTLISGYAECGLTMEALETLEQMKAKKIFPNAVTYVCALGACGELRDANKGQELHMRIIKEGYDRDNIIGNSLVGMYARCGHIAEAEDGFNKLSEQDIISYSALIAGYAELGLCEEALNRLRIMRSDGIAPDAITFVSVLKACGSRQAIESGLEIHAEIIREELEKDAFVGNKLVDFYAKCGMLLEARDVFDELEAKDEISWNSLLGGYAELMLDKEAEKLLEPMQFEGLDYTTSLCALKFYGSINDINKGRALHIKVVKGGLDKELRIENALIDMYANCAALCEAEFVFDRICRKDVVSWNTLIASYVECGFCEEALACVEDMRREGLTPDVATYLSSLKACSKMGYLDEGQKFHSEIAKEGYERDLFLGNALLDMYAKSGSLPLARAVFEELPNKDVILWNTLLSGYAKYGPAEETLRCLGRMEMMGLPLDATTYVSALNACGSVADILKGRDLHSKIVEEGFDTNVYVGNSLVDMYFKWGLISEARAVFDELPIHDTVSWNVIAAGYADCGLEEQVFSCLEQMQAEGISPDSASFVSFLKACSGAKSVMKGWELHDQIAKEGLERDPFVGTALIDMYTTCGALMEAREVFDESSAVGDVVLWTAMLWAYAGQDEDEEALLLYLQMLERGLMPNAMTFCGVLKACGNTGDLRKGNKLHAQLWWWKDMEVIVTSALIEMYGKCGRMRDAQQVFDTSRSRGLTGWTSLISGYARNGETGAVFELFEKMKRGEEGLLWLDEVTFLGVLSACSHGGLVKDGRRYFDSMASYGVTPSIEHYNCMIDLLGRAGRLEEAVLALESMPFQIDAVGWSTLLDACRRWGHVDLGGHAFASMSEKGASGSFILMSNLYVDNADAR